MTIEGRLSGGPAEARNSCEPALREADVFLLQLDSNIAAAATSVLPEPAKGSSKLSHVPSFSERLRLRFARPSAGFAVRPSYGLSKVLQDSKLFLCPCHGRCAMAGCVDDKSASGLLPALTAAVVVDLHRQGKTADEIAAMRGLTVGTSKSHLARLIASGAIKVHEVLPTRSTRW